MAQIQLIFFRQGKLRGRLLPELQIFFRKKFTVPAAKRIRADLFQIFAQEIEKVVSGRKQTRNIYKNVGIRTVRKQSGVGETSNVEEVKLYSFLKDIFDKTNEFKSN